MTVPGRWLYVKVPPPAHGATACENEPAGAAVAPSSHSRPWHAICPPTRPLQMTSVPMGGKKEFVGAGGGAPVVSGSGGAIALGKWDYMFVVEFAA